MHVARVNENRNAHEVLIGRPKGLRLLGIANCRWEGSIKMGNAQSFDKETRRIKTTWKSQL